MKNFVSLQEAIDILNKNVNVLGYEEVDLIKGLNRISAEDIYSKINNPPFNKSAMDGYAIISNEYLKVGDRLKIIDTVYAGDISRLKVKKGTAIKIMTGAPIPEGSNCVIKQEDITLKNGFIEINKINKVNENICFEGEDISKGSILVSKNKKLNYADIGILASSGINKLKVYKKPKIAFISTGDEVVDIYEEFTEGKIYNSNKYSILSRIEELNYEVSSINHVKDSTKNMGECIGRVSKISDLIITTGGVSVGDKDLIKEAIDIINGEKLFWKITIKPGSAVLCSKLNETLIISLSGNPIASLTTFELLVRTTLEKLSGNGDIQIKREKAYLLGEFNKKSPQLRFIRGRTIYNEGKQCVEIIQTKSGNGILSSAIDSNCLIEIQAGNECVKYGELVNIIKF